MGKKADTSEDIEKTVPTVERIPSGTIGELSFERSIELRLAALVAEQKEQNLRIEAVYKRMDTLIPRIDRLLEITNKTLKMYQREHTNTVLRQKNMEETMRALFPKMKG